MPLLAEKLKAWIAEQQLPQHYQQGITDYIQPLAQHIIRAKQQGQSLVVGINGAQGSGKSTLSACLALLLEDKGYQVAMLSLDDLYLNQAKRKQLAQNIHPLLQTRGVPGTHDVALGIKALQMLQHGQGQVLLPRFDKRIDNPKPKDEWETCLLPVDIVLFEGWCVGSVAQPDQDLSQPINALEAEEDKQGVWRGFVNQQLRTIYSELYADIDMLIYLDVPSFAQVFTWRKQQEQQTFQGKGMADAELKRFIAHYERLTLWNKQTMPDLADIILKLDAEQKIYALN